MLQLIPKPFGNLQKQTAPKNDAEKPRKLLPKKQQQCLKRLVRNCQNVAYLCVRPGFGNLWGNPLGPIWTSHGGGPLVQDSQLFRRI